MFEAGDFVQGGNVSAVGQKVAGRVTPDTCRVWRTLLRERAPFGGSQRPGGEEDLQFRGHFAGQRICQCELPVRRAAASQGGSGIVDERPCGDCGAARQVAQAVLAHNRRDLGCERSGALDHRPLDRHQFFLFIPNRGIVEPALAG